MPVTSISLDTEMLQWLDHEAKMHAMSRSEFIRQLVAVYQEWQENGGEL